MFKTKYQPSFAVLIHALRSASVYNFQLSQFFSLFQAFVLGRVSIHDKTSKYVKTFFRYFSNLCKTQRPFQGYGPGRKETGQAPGLCFQEIPSKFFVKVCLLSTRSLNADSDSLSVSNQSVTFRPYNQLAKR